MGGKIIPRIRLSSAKVLVEVEAELGNIIVSYERPTAEGYRLQLRCVF